MKISFTINSPLEGESQSLDERKFVVAMRWGVMNLQNTPHRFAANKFLQIPLSLKGRAKEWWASQKRLLLCSKVLGK